MEQELTMEELIALINSQKHLKQQSERKWRCDNGRRDSGSGADHPCCL